MSEVARTGSGSDRVSLDASGDTRTVHVPGTELPRPPIVAGSTVSRYVVLEELGRGGMGQVLRAYDPKLEREVALKEVRGDVLDHDAAPRLVAEARAMAKLSHPNVVAVYDVEEVSSNRVVLVMECVRGPTLKQWLREQPRGPREVVQCFVAAGRGLAAAHQAGVLHRDFKPANVLVADRSTVKVTDFGIAKTSAPHPSSELVASSDSVSELTQAGTVMGTPRYMAPEQHRGRELTTAADQYSFCVALWEALCGASPFDGEDMAGSKQSGPPTWPRGDTPRRIVSAIVRGLSPNPEDRWPSMAELLAALEWEPSRTRNRVLLGVGAIGVSSLAVASYQGWAQQWAQRCSGAERQLVGVWDAEKRAQVQSAFAAVDKPYAEQAWSRTQAVLDDYAHQWAATYGDTCEAATVRGEQSPQLMDLRMACLHRAIVELSSTVDVLADADAKVVQNAHQLTGRLHPLARCSDIEALAAEVEPPGPQEAEAVEAAQVRLSEAGARLEAGRYREAKASIEQARTALVGVEYGPVQTELALIEGDALQRLGEYAAAEAVLVEALRLAARWRQWASMRQAANGLLFVVGDRQKRIEDALRYRPLAEGLSLGDRVDEAMFRNNLAIVLEAQGKPAEAEAEYRAALALREAALGPDHPDVAGTRNNLADVLGDQGKYAEAEAEHRAALAVRVAALGPDHPDVAASRNNLATVLYLQGKYEPAEAEYRAALALLVAALGPGHPDAAGARANVAIVLGAQGKHAEAEAEFRAALALRLASLDPEHPDVAASRYNLASSLQDQGKYAEAEVELRQALASFEAAHGRDHPDVVAARNSLASILHLEGKSEEAEAEYRAALESSEAALGPDHRDVAASRSTLADVLLALDRPADALPLAQQAWARLRQDDVAPEHRGHSAFVLARAQWQVAVGAEDRTRARSLAEDALRTYRAPGDTHRNAAAEVQTWLDARPTR